MPTGWTVKFRRLLEISSAFLTLSLSLRKLSTPKTSFSPSLFLARSPRIIRAEFRVRARHPIHVSEIREFPFFPCGSLSRSAIIKETLSRKLEQAKKRSRENCGYKLVADITVSFNFSRLKDIDVCERKKGIYIYIFFEGIVLIQLREIVFFLENKCEMKNHPRNNNLI